MGVEIFGVSFDGEDANRRFAEKRGFPYRLLCDTTRTMGLAYRACQRASDPVPDRITYVVGPDGRIERAIRTEDPGGQASELVDSLTSDGTCELTRP